MLISDKNWKNKQTVTMMQISELNNLKKNTRVGENQVLEDVVSVTVERKNAKNSLQT